MSMAKTIDVEPELADTALDRLVNREDVLQICYWFQGEGFGDVYNSMVLAPFLNCQSEAIDAALSELVEDGHLVATTASSGGFQFTADGKKQGGRLFGDTFADYARQGHGECAAGCCDGDDHSQCGDECTLH